MHSSLSLFLLTGAKLAVIETTILKTKTRAVAITRQRTRVHRVIGQHLLNDAAAIAMFAAQVLRGAEVQRGRSRRGEQE